MMRGIRISAVAVLSIGLSGCASLIGPTDPVAPLTLAFTAPVAEIEAGAARGDNDSEYALAFLMTNRLKGLAPEPGQIRRLRQGAQSPTTLTITQYIPAVGGGAGRTNIIPVQQGGISPAVMTLLDRCGASLLFGVKSVTDRLCPAGVYERLGPAARQAAADRAARTPLP